MGIVVRALSKRFTEGGHKKDVLNGLDLEVRPGEIYLLKGANGAGKTTLLKIIAGLVAQSSGTVMVNGVNNALSPLKARRITGLAHDCENSFYDFLDYEKNIRFYARLFGLRDDLIRQRIDELSEAFGLKEYKGVRLSHCSSGIKQRISLARALVPRPEVLLIDELTKSLDESSVSVISGHIRNYVTKGKRCCLIVTHEPAALAGICDKAGTLAGGRVTEHRSFPEKIC